MHSGVHNDCLGCSFLNVELMSMSALGTLDCIKIIQVGRKENMLLRENNTHCNKYEVRCHFVVKDAASQPINHQTIIFTA